MKYRRVKLLFFVTLISAMLIVPVAAAPPGGGGGGATYAVYGYVKESGTGNKIPGAMVILYKVDEVNYAKVASQLTNSDGRFSFSTYQSSMPIVWEVRVSKSGYESNTKHVACRGRTTNMGTVYLTPAVPPDEPEIIVTSAEWRNSEFTLNWGVLWGRELYGTSYRCYLYWSEDNVFTPEEVVFQSPDEYTTFYSATVQSPHRGDWWYRIFAYASNNYGNRDDEVIAPTLGVILPEADAYTYSGEPATNYGASTYLWAGTPLFLNDARAYLKFTLPNPDEVTSVSLFAYKCNIGTHDGVSAYSVDNSWDEMSICWSNQPEYDPRLNLLDIDPEGSYGFWDCWDVTEIAKNPSGFSVVLHYRGDTLNLLDVVDYTSKEGPVERRPHLLVQYKTALAGIPFDTIGIPQDVAITDEFDNETASMEIWTPTRIGDPNDYLFSDGVLGVGGLGIVGPNTGPIGWKFSQDNLRYQDGFHFQIDVGNQAMFPLLSPGAITAGIALYSDDYSSEDPFCGLFLQYRVTLRVEGIPVSWQQVIAGFIGTQYEEEVISTEKFAFAELAINRDPITKDIRLLYQLLDSPIELLLNESSSYEIDSLDLISAFVDVPLANTGSSSFSSFREFPVQLARNPEISGNNFYEPLVEYSFEDYSRVIGNWDEYMTNGELSSTEARHGFPPQKTSWHVSTSEGLHFWKMGQEVGSGSIDALKNQIVGFSIFAHSSSTTSMMRAEIGYEVEGELYEACGEWQVLNDGDDSWIELSACTRYPLPETLTSLEVRVVGLGYKDELFSAYIDYAQLKLVAPSHTSCSFGDLILSSSIYQSNVNGDSTIDFLTQPVVGVYARDGWYISSVRMNIDIIPPMTTTNFASMYDVIEGNNQEIDYQTPQEYENWLHQITMFREIAKWTIRGVSFYFGAGPVGWGVSETVDAFIQSILLTNRDPDDGSTLAGPGEIEGHAHEDVNYQPEFIGLFPWISMLGCNFGWTVRHDNHDLPPLVRVTFVVDWCSFAGVLMETTAVGMCIAISLS